MVTPPTTPVMCIEPCAFGVGDVVWAKLSNHSWWPCMISTPKLAQATSPRHVDDQSLSLSGDGGGDNYIRFMSASRRHKRMLYVEFFGPLVEHGWVIESNVLAYTGGDPDAFFADYALRLADKQTTRSSRDKVVQKYTLATPPPPYWEAAVREADEALLKKPLERKLAFIRKHSTHGGVVVKGANKFNPKSTNGTGHNDFDDLDNHTSPFEIVGTS